MDNKEEKNIPQIDDFEIIDIPMDNGSEINDNINIANDMSQIEQPVEILSNLVEENPQSNYMNNEYQTSDLNSQQSFDTEMLKNNEQDMNFEPSYNEISPESFQVSYNEMPQPTMMDQPVENDIFGINNEVTNENVDNNYNQVENLQMNVEDNINSDSNNSDNINSDSNNSDNINSDSNNSDNINSDSNNSDIINDEPTSNVYIPKKEVSTSKEQPKEKLDKSLKEMITMGIIVAIVIIFLPFLYNLSTGKYHVISNIKNAFSGLFPTEEKVESQGQSQEEVVEEVEETTPVEEVETNKANDTTNTNLTFDFSAYHNQVIDNVALSSLLTNYQNNIISLTPSTINGKQLLKIEIAKDVASAEYSISNPANALESFNKQYLAVTSNYLISTASVNDNVIAISAAQQ